MAIPIPKRPVGYRLGAGDALIQIEAFVDVECPFSKKAWPTLLDIANTYSPEEVSITIYPVVLADHRQSWDVTKTAVLLANGDALQFWNFLSYLYQRQEKYVNTAFDHQTRQNLYDLLAHFAADFADETDAKGFIKTIQSDELSSQAKHPIRYAITRGVWSTPTFFINGAEAPDLSSASTIAVWQSTLDDLLS